MIDFNSTEMKSLRKNIIKKWIIMSHYALGSDTINLPFDDKCLYCGGKKIDLHESHKYFYCEGCGKQIIKNYE